VTDQFRRPAADEVYAFLRERNALIVHFSGTPKGAGSNFDHLYPADLQSVIAGVAMGGLSCSVVCPGDEFEDLDSANATGCIGVVLGLRSGESLVAVDPHDCGSMVGDGNIREARPMPEITVATMERTLNERPA